MGFITEDYFTDCTNCNKQMNSYYIDLRFGLNGKVCCECLVKAYNDFPKGKGKYYPCKL